jgi:V8-like Glu-specific endopeptidase
MRPSIYNSFWQPSGSSFETFSNQDQAQSPMQIDETEANEVGAMDTFTIVDHVYDPSIAFVKDIFNHYREKKTLSTLPQHPKKEHMRQRVLIYDKQPQPFEEERVLMKIGNKDGRERIVDTTQWPYRFHAQLGIIFKKQLYGGSGSMVGPRHLLTCAHNVYDHKDGWAEKISVYLALNESSAPFGEVEVAKVYTFKNWVEDKDPRFDMALLILKRSIGKYTGWGGLLSADKAELDQETVHITGYPGDKHFKQMWSMNHKLHVIYPEEFEYEIDTHGGQSGSAIWINKYGSTFILGVHTLGSYVTNRGVRISQKKFTDFLLKIISNTWKIDKSTLPPLLSTSSVSSNPQTVPFSAMAFGKAQWAEYFGDCGAEPPLPPNINQILASPCPFWPEKKVAETHLFVLIPPTLDGKPLTLNSLGERVKRPKKGHATQYRFIWDEIVKALGQQPTSRSHWVLMTREVIPGSRGKSYANQQALVAQLAKGMDYTVLSALEAAICVFVHYVRKQERLLSDDPWTYTRCQEEVQGLRLAVGGFSLAGLDVRNISFGRSKLGLAPLRKFF